MQLARSGDHSRAMPLKYDVSVSEPCDVIRVMVTIGARSKSNVEIFIGATDATPLYRKTGLLYF